MFVSDKQPVFLQYFVSLERAYGLTPNEVKLYGLVYFYAEKSYNKTFNLANSEIANRLNLSEASVNRLIAKLKNCGLITTNVSHLGTGNSRKIVVLRLPNEVENEVKISDMLVSRSVASDMHVSRSLPQKSEKSGSRLCYIYNNIIYNKLSESSAAPLLGDGMRGKSDQTNGTKNDPTSLHQKFPVCGVVLPATQKNLTTLMSKFKLSSVSGGDGEETIQARKITDVASLTVLSAYKKYVYSACTDKTKSAVELIPQTVKMFATLFDDKAVECLTHAIQALSSTRSFRELKTKDIRIVAPVNFFRKTFVENNLIPFGQKYYDEVCGTTSSEAGRNSVLRDQILREADIVADSFADEKELEDIVL